MNLILDPATPRDVHPEPDALPAPPPSPPSTRVVMRPARICGCLRAMAEGRRVACEPYCDWRFIADSWLKAGRSDWRWKNAPAQVYFSLMRAWISELARRKDVALAIASDPDRDHRILGWVCWSPKPPLPVPVVHFLLVRGEARGRKLTWAMLDHAGIARTERIAYTCAPKSAKWLARKFASATHTPLQEFLA